MSEAGLREFVESFCALVETADRRASSDSKGGQQVMETNPLVYTFKQQPSVRRELTWWSRAFREVLAKEKREEVL